MGLDQISKSEETSYVCLDMLSTPHEELTASSKGLCIQHLCTKTAKCYTKTICIYI